MIIDKIQTHLDSISGQKQQKMQIFLDHIYIFLVLLRNSMSDEKYI